ncbi:MAG: hypothetical protein LBB22_02800, partial [Treponema sp.]|nr:hypothetical protein [Treponema sp.]
MYAPRLPCASNTPLETCLLSVAFKTLGCKLNQAETETMAAAFSNAGFPVVSSENDAGLLIVNTCAVTSKAEQKGRRMIRAALRRNPDCCVLVTGCYAELNRNDLESLDDSIQQGSVSKRIFIVPGIQKNAIMDMPSRLAHDGIRNAESLGAALEKFCFSGTDDTFRFEAAKTALRSRVFLKIQDGCD